jgi:hypothetical protein
VPTAEDFPYETRLNLLHEPLEVIDEKALSNACTYKWFNQTLCRVNESVVRLGVVEGEYHWHKHENDDEFFYVIEGELFIDLEYRTIKLLPRQGFVLPKECCIAHALCSARSCLWWRTWGSSRLGISRNNDPFKRKGRQFWRPFFFRSVRP